MRKAYLKEEHCDLGTSHDVISSPCSTPDKRVTYGEFQEVIAYLVQLKLPFAFRLCSRLLHEIKNESAHLFGNKL